MVNRSVGDDDVALDSPNWHHAHFEFGLVAAEGKPPLPWPTAVIDHPLLWHDAATGRECEGNLWWLKRWAKWASVVGYAPLVWHETWLPWFDPRWQGARR